MKQERYWVIFQIVTGNVASWLLSDKKHTKEEVERIDKAGEFDYDFTSFGLDVAGSIRIITGYYFCRGTKKDAEEMERILNEKGIFGALGVLEGNT